MLACAPGYDCGVVSWYGREFTHRRMANGQRFDPRELVAASLDYPLGTVLEVTSVLNGWRVRVTVQDRGPAPQLHRLLDLSEGAAHALGFHNAGLAEVRVMVLKYKNCD